MFVCCECCVLSSRGLCDELITRPEESYRLCCVVVCDLETSRMGAPYIYDISRLRVKQLFLSATQMCFSEDWDSRFIVTPMSVYKTARNHVPVYITFYTTLHYIHISFQTKLFLSVTNRRRVKEANQHDGKIYVVRLLV